jgi:hypothetical protein
MGLVDPSGQQFGRTIDPSRGRSPSRRAHQLFWHFRVMLPCSYTIEDGIIEIKAADHVGLSPNPDVTQCKAASSGAQEA